MSRPQETSAVTTENAGLECGARAIINSSSMVTKPKKDARRLPATLRDELRRTLAIKCYNTICGMSSMKVSEQHLWMFRLYHGDQGDGISNLDLLCKGESPYDDLFKHVKTGNVVNPNATQAASLKQLKCMYSLKDVQCWNVEYGVQQYGHGGAYTLHVFV